MTEEVNTQDVVQEVINSDVSVEAIGLIDKYMGNVVTAVEQAAVTYGPEVVEIGLWVVRIDNIQTLVWSCISFIVGLVLLHLCKRWFDHVNQVIADDSNRQTGPNGIDGVLFLGLLGSGSLFLLNGFFGIIKIWTWTGIFYPELYLAKQAIDAVLN